MSAPRIAPHLRAGSRARLAGAVLGLCLASSLLACGGRALDPDAADGSVGEGARDGGRGSEGGVACAPLPGCTSTLWCADRCNECGCDQTTGTWGCTKRFCDDKPPPPAACPPEPPVEGTPCSVPRQECGGFERCAPKCVCKDSRWSCNANPCGLPCPATAPVNRERCEARGQVCRYTGFCAPTCTCGPVTPDLNAWRCSTPPC